MNNVEAVAVEKVKQFIAAGIIPVRLFEAAIKVEMDIDARIGIDSPPNYCTMAEEKI